MEAARVQCDAKAPDRAVSAEGNLVCETACVVSAGLSLVEGVDAV